MDARKFSGIVAAVLVATAGLSQAENAGRIEPLDGGQSVKGLSDTRSGRSPLDTRLVIPQGDTSSRATGPFGTPLPPHQLTPAPVLPFNPNGPLMPNSPAMPTPSAPAPHSGGGRAGR